MSEKFVLPFQGSEHPGPDDPKSIMYRIHASNWQIRLLILYGVVVLVLTGLATVNLLPGVLSDSSAPGDSSGNWELNLLVLVLCFGTLGGLVHLFSSLSRYVGDRRLQRSWLLFYYLRPPVGALLAVVFYFVLRLGVLSPAQITSVDAKAVNVYGVLTFAALAGMFARQAVDKLAEIFEVLFKKVKEDISEKSAAELFQSSPHDDLMARLAPAQEPTRKTFNDEEEVVDED
jgi:hypothetical protein